MPALIPTDRRRQPPDRLLPLWYFGFAHLCLLAACAEMALEPAAVAGFFYHPRMLAVVHLVTLGWISSSILGAFHLIGPMALKAPLPVYRLDWWALAFHTVGTLGLVAHFWIDEPNGLAWAAPLLILAFARVGWRVLRALRPAAVPPEIKLHFYLGFANILTAAAIGLLIALDKISPLLPGHRLAVVVGHAHLAALGWATMIVMAAGYRLLPMFLPAAMPRGPRVWASALLTETGVLGLTAALMLQSRWAGVFGLVAIAGLGFFFERVAWMLRNRRPAPRGLLRPDLGLLHVAAALLCLVLAALLGLALAWTPPGVLKLGAILAYGALGLVGFLAQMVVGVANRLLPLYFWSRAVSGSDYRLRPPSPHVLPARSLQAAVLGLWGVGVPFLALGLALDRRTWLQGAGAALTLAVLVGIVNLLVMLRRAARRSPVEAKAAGGAT